MFYPQNVLEEVRMGNDIVDVIGSYTQLKQKGILYFGLCPFHKERTPSFSVNAEKQLYYCFGCGASGNVIGFIMQIENYSFIEAIKYLADKIRYTLPEEEQSQEAKLRSFNRNLLYEIHKKAARYFYDTLNSKDGIQALEYLEGRQLTKSVRNKFGLGYASDKRDGLYKLLLSNGYDLELIQKSGLVLKGKNNSYYDKFYNRLMFPIIDVNGRVIGFGGRILGNGEPKYLNSPETEIFSKSKNLYNINLARLSKEKELILVEGYMDAIKIYQAGFKNVIASLGTAFNDEHAKQLKKYSDSVILLFDADEAGVNAALRAIPVLVSHGLRVRVLNTPDAKDPDEYIKKYGAEKFGELLQNAQNYISFQVNCIRNRYNMHNTEHKILFTNEIVGLLSKVTNEIERDVYIKEVSYITNISEDAIKAEVNKTSDNIEISLQKKTYTKQKLDVPETGIHEARKNILNIFINNTYVSKILKAHLEPYEFIEDDLIRLCEILYEHINNNINIYAAEIVNNFTEIKEQKQISEIFMLEQKFEDNKELEKAVNDQIKVIKKAYIDDSFSNNTDVSKIQELINQKKDLDKLYITLN